MALTLADLFFYFRRYLACWVFLFLPVFCAAQQTTVSGRVTDAVNGQPLAFINVVFPGTTIGTSTDDAGKFTLTANASFSRIAFSGMGYQPLIRIIKPGTDNRLQVKLAQSQTELKEVSVNAGKSKRYSNKDNPAVELIRQVISHKDSNRMESTDYLQYQQYERLGLTIFDVPKVLSNNFLFRPYSFMFDTVGGKISAPIYLSEKQYDNYLRRTPEKKIRVLKAEKVSNIIKFIDTVALNGYLNRLYGDQIDIYENNLFVLNTQFLSPIANHSPDFYKFFITDTIHTGAGSFIELDFVPRNKGDLLFEGHLLVTLDGRYAITSCEMRIDGQINLNFVRKLDIVLDFEQHTGGRYFLNKSDVKVDFGILKSKGVGVRGERLAHYSNYIAGTPLDAEFYKGRDEQILPGSYKPDTSFWKNQRPDSLPGQQAVFYKRMSKLEQMHSFKTLTWFASTLSGGYADTGPFQFNLNDLLAYSQIEGLRYGVGGRTTPKFNRSVYLEGYVADGTTDHHAKYEASAFYAFNQTPFYRFPNNYIKVSQQYDITLPGSNSGGTGNYQSPLSSFQTGTNKYYFYSNTFKLDYVKDYLNHLSLDIGITNRDQRAAGALTYTLNDGQNTIVDHITSSTVNLFLRYAPHEQIFQGTDRRTIIESKYPIFTLQMVRGFKGVLNGSTDYSSFTGTVEKRFYMSQLGFADVTLMGNLITGKVPFPLLNISPANQSIVYDPDSYNLMKDLEFVSDHYAGVNITQSFNGFFLNKTPLIKHLKWREYISFKALYGGLRAENNPYLTSGLYNFPVPAAGTTGTYALGNTPYFEGGAGVGNIFKLFRVDAIRRFNYLDHPGVSKSGLKLTLNINI